MGWTRCLSVGAAAAEPTEPPLSPGVEMNTGKSWWSCRAPQMSRHSCNTYPLSVLAPARSVSALLQSVHLGLELDTSTPRQLHFSSHFIKLHTVNFPSVTTFMCWYTCETPRDLLREQKLPIYIPRWNCRQEKSCRTSCYECWKYAQQNALRATQR